MTTFSHRVDRHMTATAKMWRVRDLPVCVSSRSEDEELLANEKLLLGSAIFSSLCGFHVSLFSQIQLKLLKTEFMMSNWGVVCTKWVLPSSAAGETASFWSQTIYKIINSISWCQTMLDHQQVKLLILSIQSVYSRSSWCWFRPELLHHLIFVQVRVHIQLQVQTAATRGSSLISWNL